MFIAIGSGLLVLLGLVGAQTDAPWWNQPQGNAAGTSASTLAALRTQPVERWRVAAGEVIAEPVVWGGIVYAVVQDGERELLALRVSDGERLGSARLGRGGAVHVAVWNGTVLVVEEDQIRSFTSRKGVLKSAKRLDLAPRLGPPCLHAGLLLVSDGDELLCVDVERLKEIGRVPGGQGRPALAVDGATARVVTCSVRDAGENARSDLLQLDFAELAGIGGKTVELSEQPAERLAPLSPRKETSPSVVAYLARSYQWFVLSPRRILAQNGAALPSCRTSGALSSIATRPAVLDDDVYGFDVEGTLIAFVKSGGYAEVVPKERFPAGAREGAASIASGVLYLANWAVEIESCRVLWCLPELDPVTPLVPSDHGSIVVGTSKGELIGLSERSSAPVAAAEPSSAVQPSAALGQQPVVIFGDGRVLAGPAAREPDGRLRVGEELLELDSIAFADLGEDARLVRDEFPVYLAWRSQLHEELQTALEALASAYASERHLSEARRVLQEALEYGLPAARQRALEDALAGKQENRDANAAAKLRKKQEQERERRRALLASFHAAAAWCRERGMWTAATVLLARSRRILPDEGTVEACRLAEELVPPEFPWREGDDVPRLWMDWAEVLLTAGARFLPRDDPAWKGPGERWANAVALRTQNLLLFSRDRDPAVVGPCLLKGEGTIRVLDELLPPVDGQPLAREPLEVRIHADRESYLKEDAEDLPWTAGYYSPRENISRFYVPHAADKSRVDRALHYTLAHELTHHHVDRRWIRAVPEADAPGFWIEEGFARFVEDQALEMGRADRNFEDPTVRSVDVASQAALAGLLIPVGELVDTSHASFFELSGAPLAEIQLRYTLARPRPSRRTLFYDEAGSLVFFLVNRCGPRGREALFDYMKEYRSGRAQPDGWKALGWESPDALQAEFLAFLRTVSG